MPREPSSHTSVRKPDHLLLEARHAKRLETPHVVSYRKFQNPCSSVFYGGFLLFCGCLTVRRFEADEVPFLRAGRSAEFQVHRLHQFGIVPSEPIIQ